MRFDTDIYKTIRNEELTSILDNINHTLLIENIKSQLECPFNDHYINHLESYIETIAYLLDDFEDVGVRNDIIEISRMTYTKVIKYIKKKFNFDIDINNINLETTASVLYDFFIYFYKNNVFNFYINFIKSNKKSILLNLEKYRKNKDLELYINKKEIKNRNDALIISNIFKIVEMIRHVDINSEDFISYITKNNETFTNNQINKLFIDDDIVYFENPLKEAYLDILYDDSSINNIIIEVQLELFRTSDRKY